METTTIIAFKPYRYSWVTDTGERHTYTLIALEKNGYVIKELGWTLQN